MKKGKRHRKQERRTRRRSAAEISTQTLESWRCAELTKELLDEYTSLLQMNLASVMGPNSDRVKKPVAFLNKMARIEEARHWLDRHVERTKGTWRH